MNAAAAIRRARQQAGLTQVELARRAGTSQATLSAYERGSKRPSVATLERLLSAAGLRLAVVPGARLPDRGELERRGRVLADVLTLAEALPARHEPRLGFPRLPDGPA